MSKTSVKKNWRVAPVGGAHVAMQRLRKRLRLFKISLLVTNKKITNLSASACARIFEKSSCAASNSATIASRPNPALTANMPWGGGGVRRGHDEGGGTNVVGLARRQGGDEVGHGDVRRAVVGVGLLAEGAEDPLRFASLLILVKDNVVARRIGGKYAENGTGCEALVLDDVFKHPLRVLKHSLRFSTCARGHFEGDCNQNEVEQIIMNEEARGDGRGGGGGTYRRLGR
jgi:hypothetical protein